jgi:riboflavin kinase / FMN adenylyltransferase
MALLFQGSPAYPGHEHRPVATIGNFDGLHRGHQALVGRLLERAVELDAPSLVYTFDPPPRLVLQPGKAPPRIATLEQKVEGLFGLGVDHVVVETFTADFGARPPDWFARVIIGRLEPRAMVVGYDFRYGQGRAGNAQTLAAQRPELPIETVEALQFGDLVVGSSRIREAVAEGRIEAANKMLGRPYRLVGTVVQGDARGRTIGFPTANLDAANELIPAPGVYAVRSVFDGKEHAGVANLGVRPTFDGARFVIEVHLFDFEGDLYGRSLPVDFVARIRGERRFESADELVAQIRLDAVEARRVLEC